MLRKLGYLTLLVVLAAAGYYGYQYYQKNYQTTQVAAAPAVQTAVVRRGNLVISATGGGSIVPSQEVSLGFESSGRLTTLNVKVGDEVKAGDVLAVMQSSESELSLQSKVSSAELTLLKAQQDLQALYGNVSTELAQAQLDLVNTQTSLEDYQTSRQKMDYARCSSDTINDLQEKYDFALARYQDDELNTQKKKAMETALINLNWCKAGYTAEEIALVDAQIQLAQVKVDTLTHQIEIYKNGPDPDSVTLAQANITSAENQLEIAKQALEKSTLEAPFDGTLLSVDAQVGDIVGSSPFITLADLAHPQLQVYLDETDLNNIGVGYEVDVTFDALPDQTFVGHVISVDPSLVRYDNVPSVQGLVQIDPESFSKPQTLPVGLNASVEVIGSKAENVLLVPVEALREITAGQYAVFVMVNNEPKLQMVEVGLMDYTYAEIKSGLNEGDVVTTGIVETGQ